MRRDHPSSGPFSARIAEFVAEKRALGYDYSGEWYELARFDGMCLALGLAPGPGGGVTKEMADAWAGQRPGEGLGHRAHRVSFLRVFSTWLLGRGAESYVPRGALPEQTPCVRVPNRGEAQAIAAAADARAGSLRGSPWPWVSAGVAAMVRLLYLCGMRVGECCALAAGDVDLAAGTVRVLGSKGNRDRLVYLGDGLPGYLGRYRSLSASLVGAEPDWWFPGRDPARHVPKSSVDKAFAEIWGATPFAGSGRRPTPHSLRHAFVVERMDAWAAEGAPLDSAMPYLASYLGHSSPSETMYYYHLAEGARAASRRAGAAGIPEAVPYGR